MINPTASVPEESVYDLYIRAVQAATVTPGLFLEFGVASGTTMQRFYDVIRDHTDRRDMTLYGFDSFLGLPEAWYTEKVGAFACPPPKSLLDLEVRNNRVVFVEGWFSDTLPTFLAEHPEPCWLVHIDCDLYSSTKCVLTLLKDRIVPGTVIVFDELINYTGYEDHEIKAFEEFLNESHREFVYLSRSTNQAAVQITK